MREYFCAYHSMLDATRKLSDAEVGRLFRGLLRYSMTEEQPHDLHGREEIVFDIYSQQTDREIAKYNEACKRNKRNAATRYDPQPVAASRSQSQQEEDKGKGKDKGKDKDKGDYQDDARADADPLVMYAVNNLQFMSPGNLHDLAGYAEDLPADVIRFAIDEGCANGAPRWSYVSAILRGYLRDGIKTVGDAKAAKAKRKTKLDRSPQDNPALNFEQREYKDEDFGDDFFIDLDKYGEGTT